MGFLIIFYKYMIQQYFIVQIFLPHPTAPTAPLRPHLRSSEFYKAPYINDTVACSVNQHTSLQYGQWFSFRATIAPVFVCLQHI